MADKPGRKNTIAPVLDETAVYNILVSLQIAQARVSGSLANEMSELEAEIRKLCDQEGVSHRDACWRKVGKISKGSAVKGRRLIPKRG